MPISKSTAKSLHNIDEFLSKFDEYLSQDLSLKKGIKLNFKLLLNRESNKYAPYLYLAETKDAPRIAELYNTIYRGTYPYREMQDQIEVFNLIQGGKYNWILFKNEQAIIIGCMGFYLELENKKAYLFGFVVDEKYLGITDNLKTFIGCLLILWKLYKDKVLLWYSETRTAHNTAQFAQNLGGLKPIAFFPNKDIFYGKYESEFFHVIYDEKLIKKYRSSKKPELIRQCLNCYLYSKGIFKLGKPIVTNPNIKLNTQLMKYLDNNLVVRKELKNNVYEIVKFYYRESQSYFQFFLNHENNSAESTIYEVENFEELEVFLKKLNQFIKKQNIRYFQCFVSSYEPNHQKLFFDNNLIPYGYIPCWKYDKSLNRFYDSIIFIYYEGKINPNIKLIPETTELLNALNFFTDLKK